MIEVLTTKLDNIFIKSKVLSESRKIPKRTSSRSSFEALSWEIEEIFIQEL